MASYYVDSNAAGGGDGSFATPWDQLSDITGITAGDYIYLKRNSLWREQLTVTYSGTSNSSRVTFDAYGDGSAPIISGFDVISSSGWTSTPDIINDNFNDNDISDWTTTGSISAANQRVEVTSVDATGDYAYKSMTAASEFYFAMDLNINSLSWGNGTLNVLGGLYYSGDGSWRMVVGLYNNGSSTVFMVIWKDDSGDQYSATPITFTTGVDYHITCHWKKSTGAGANNGIIEIGVNGSGYRYTTCDNDTLSNPNLYMVGYYTTNASSGYSATYYFDNAKLATFPVGYNLWTKTITIADPMALLIDGTAYYYRKYYSRVYGGELWGYEVIADSTKKLVLYSTSDPSGFSSIELSSRDYGIVETGQDYLTFKNIVVKGARVNGIAIHDGTDYVIVDNVNCSYCGYSGIAHGNSGAVTGYSGQVINSTFTYNGGNGIAISDYADGWLIRNNLVHHNCINDYLDYTAGIKFSNYWVTNTIVEHNVSHSNGIGLAAKGGSGSGIWFDFCGDGNIIRYNECYSNYEYGIFSEVTDYTEIYYNVSWGNVQGISIQARSGEPATYCKMYNNVSYGNSAYGISVYAQDTGGSNKLVNNEIKNNISTGNANNLVAYNGGENDGTQGSGNVYTYNCFGAEATNFIYWGSYKATYDAWETSYGGSTYSVEGDPLFVDTAGKDFHVNRSTSPCLNAGTNVGLTKDKEGHNLRGKPDVGAYECDKDFNIRGYEVLAYRSANFTYEGKD